MTTDNIPNGFEEFIPKMDELLQFPIAIKRHGANKWAYLANGDEFMQFLLYNYTFTRPIEGSYMDERLKQAESWDEVREALRTPPPPVIMWPVGQNAQTSEN